MKSTGNREFDGEAADRSDGNQPVFFLLLGLAVYRALHFNVTARLTPLIIRPSTFVLGAIVLGVLQLVTRRQEAKEGRWVIPFVGTLAR